MNTSISRRQFLKASGLAAAGACAAGLLTGCGGSSSGSASGAASSGSGSSYTILYDSQPATLNYLTTGTDLEMVVGANCVDTLVEYDNKGVMREGLATSWDWDADTLTWTFHLREENWVDCNGEVKEHITATDFLVGLEWVLNASKNEANNTSMPTLYIVGAEEYYEKTKDMGAAAADLRYQDMLDAGVGLEAPDDYTLVFTCKDPCPYFDTVAAYTSFYPASQVLIDELGIETFRGCDNTNMWYCGPYIVEEYIQGNTKSYIPNPHYYDAANVSRFERLTVTMISDQAIAFQLYQNRELDEIDLNESTITTITSDPNNKHNKFLCEKRPTKFSFQMHLNFQRKDENGNLDENWNKAVANRAFRQCFYKGINFTNYYARTNKINPLKCENDYYTMPGVCYNTKGEEYTTLVAKEMGFDSQSYDGKTMIRLRDNGGDIADLKKQAMEELSAIGVTFPVHCYHYIKSGDTTALDTATVLKQCFTDSFGDDFIQLDLGTYVSSLAKEVRIPKLHGFVINGWGADFGDPVNFLGQEVLSDDNAYYAQTTSWIAAVEKDPKDYQKELLADYQEFTDLVTEAKAIVTDTDARYAAFAKAEASMLNNALCIPCLYEVLWCLTHVNEYTKINAMYGPCNYKAVNWETRQGDGYTTEEYEAFSAAFNAATKA